MYINGPRRCNNRFLKLIRNNVHAITNQGNLAGIPYNTRKELEYCEILLISDIWQENKQYLDWFENDATSQEQLNIMSLAVLVKEFGQQNSTFNLFQRRYPDDDEMDESKYALRDRSNFFQQLKCFENKQLLFKEKEETVYEMSLSKLRLINVFFMRRLTRFLVRSNQCNRFNFMENSDHEEIQQTDVTRHQIVHNLMSNPKINTIYATESALSCRDMAMSGLQGLVSQETIDKADDDYVNKNNLNEIRFIFRDIEAEENMDTISISSSEEDATAWIEDHPDVDNHLRHLMSQRPQ